MCKGAKYTFFPKVHKKVLNITNQMQTYNYEDIMLHLLERLLSKKTRTNKCGEDVEKREQLCTVGGNAN